MNLKNTKIRQEDGFNLMSYQAHLFVALTIGFIGILFCISLYQMNKIKQAQIFFFLTIAMMAFWMFVATGYLL
jgi:phosphoglycerol transferase MdoB-like AlkP superfamily enzyme|tara:strand:- start:4 stop:222 length:219 start_codon:yes stop_codon:yes gene_type:complete